VRFQLETEIHRRRGVAGQIQGEGQIRAARRSLALRPELLLRRQRIHPSACVSDAWAVDRPGIVPVQQEGLPADAACKNRVFPRDDDRRSVCRAEFQRQGPDCLSGPRFLQLRSALCTPAAVQSAASPCGVPEWLRAPRLVLTRSGAKLRQVFQPRPQSRAALQRVRLPPWAQLRRERNRHARSWVPLGVAVQQLPQHAGPQPLERRMQPAQPLQGS
jgi:hypothetical protein